MPTSQCNVMDPIQLSQSVISIYTLAFVLINQSQTSLRLKKETAIFQSNNKGREITDLNEHRPRK